MFKCKDCKYLDWSQKFSIGYPCTNTRRLLRTQSPVSHIKNPNTPACKTGFESKGGAK